MKICLKCNKDFDDNFDFCPYCSNHLSVKPERRYCQNCGTWVNSDSDVSCCPNCNGNLVRESILEKFDEMVIQQEKEYRKQRAKEGEKFIICFWLFCFVIFILFMIFHK